jgi:streptogramin lyase
VHRDLKPSNVILADDGPRIIDFGIARVEDASRMTTAGVVIGTFAYMSPEQVRGDSAGPASDVFALGSTLAFAAAGRPPFGSESIVTIMYRIISEPPDLSGVPEDGQLRWLIEACLAKVPANRPMLADILTSLAEDDPNPVDGAPTTDAAGEAALPDMSDVTPVIGDSVPSSYGTSSSQPDTSTRTATRGGQRFDNEVTEAGGAIAPEADEPLLSGQVRAARRRKKLRLWAAAVAVIVLAVAVPLIFSTPGTAPGISLAHVYPGGPSGPSLPVGIAINGDHVWVADAEDAVTMLNASTGALTELSSSSYGFTTPFAIADDGTHVWVANQEGNSVTELDASNGALVTVISGSNYEFKSLDGIAADGTHVWVTDEGSQSVTELNASDGSLVQVLSASRYDFGSPYGIAADSTHVWVTNQGGNSITELNASDGSLVQVLSAASYGFDGPTGIADDGTHIWVTNASGNSITELNASNGTLVQVLSAASYRLNDPIGIADDGTHIWVTNAGGNSITELNASNGALTRVISGSLYQFDYPTAIAVADGHAWIANTTNIATFGVRTSAR